MRVVRSPGQSLPEQRIQASLQQLAVRASVEVTPGQIAAAGPLSALFPRGTRIYVPFLPKADFTDTVEACRLLVADGMEPVPHLPARASRSVSELRRWLTGFAETGVGSLLLIAGDRKRSAGPYENTLAILDSGVLMDHGFRRLGIAAYPEGHPLADDVQLERALTAKIDYATSTGTEMWMVTQFVFSSVPAIDWLRRRRETGCRLPIHIGIPGPAALKTLIAYAAQCGVGASARILKRRPGAARLLGPWTPDGLARDLAYHRVAERHIRFQRIHLFPFGGVKRCADWLNDLRTLPAGEPGGIGLDKDGRIGQRS